MLPSEARRYVQTALKTRPEPHVKSAPQRIPQRSRRADDVDGLSELEEKYRRPDPHFAEHLNGLFPTLQFPPELARRILTHGSHPAAIHGHNAAYSFIGAFCQCTSISPKGYIYF